MLRFNEMQERLHSIMQNCLNDVAPDCPPAPIVGASLPLAAKELFFAKIPASPPGVTKPRLQWRLMTRLLGLPP